ncbi:MAG: hypothetical protein QM626_12405 [Microbacterium sp.]|uniref:hypothetical protein n=1 Tax=Microbacterium sp. TaxID=51671 RepID=UPI0039E263DC
MTRTAGELSNGRTASVTAATFAFVGVIFVAAVVLPIAVWGMVRGDEHATEAWRFFYSGSTGAALTGLAVIVPLLLAGRLPQFYGLSENSVDSEVDGAQRRFGVFVVLVLAGGSFAASAVTIDVFVSAGAPATAVFAWLLWSIGAVAANELRQLKWGSPAQRRHQVLKERDRLRATISELAQRAQSSTRGAWATVFMWSLATTIVLPVVGGVLLRAAGVPDSKSIELGSQLSLLGLGVLYGAGIVALVVGARGGWAVLVRVVGYSFVVVPWFTLGTIVTWWASLASSSALGWLAVVLFTGGGLSVLGAIPWRRYRRSTFASAVARIRIDAAESRLRRIEDRLNEREAAFACTGGMRSSGADVIDE